MTYEDVDKLNKDNVELVPLCKLTEEQEYKFNRYFKSYIGAFLEVNAHNFYDYCDTCELLSKGPDHAWPDCPYGFDMSDYDCHSNGEAMLRAEEDLALLAEASFLWLEKHEDVVLPETDDACEPLVIWKGVVYHLKDGEAGSKNTGAYDEKNVDDICDKLHNEMKAFAVRSLTREEPAFSVNVTWTDGVFDTEVKENVTIGVKVTYECRVLNTIEDAIEFGVDAKVEPEVPERVEATDGD